MAIISCPSCKKRVSTQWPECPSCGANPSGSGAKRRRRFNPTPHYLIATTLATVGSLIYGAQFVGRVVDEGLMSAAIVMIALGACWYAAARIIAALK